MGVRKKRKPSAYNIFIGDCMRDGKSMKDCAALYKDKGIMMALLREEVRQYIIELTENKVKHQSGDVTDDLTEIILSDTAPDEKITETDMAEEDIAQIYLVVQDGCPGCKEAREAYAEDIKAGRVVLISVDEEDGEQILNDFNVEDVPALVFLMSNGEYLVYKDDGIETG